MRRGHARRSPVECEAYSIRPGRVWQRRGNLIDEEPQDLSRCPESAADGPGGRSDAITSLFESVFVFSSVQTPRLPFHTEKFPRREHPQIIDSLAQEGSEIPAVKREKHIGARERCAEHRLVLCDLKKQRPIKSRLGILDNKPVLEIKPSVGCRMRQPSQILAHFPHHPTGNHQFPILRSRQFKK